jgi:hypothetical protein
MSVTAERAKRAKKEFTTSFSLIWKKKSGVTRRAPPFAFSRFGGRQADRRNQKTLADEIQEMREIREDVRFGPSTASIVEEAEKRGIPYIRLNDQSLVQLGYGVQPAAHSGDDDRPDEYDFR